MPFLSREGGPAPFVSRSKYRCSKYREGYIYIYRKKGNVVGERSRREIVISVSPDCGPLTSRRLEPACHGINHNARICTRLGCARVRVGALTVRLNAINAPPPPPPPPLDSRRREASPIAANDRRIELTVSSNPAPRETVHCAPRQGRRGGGRYLESSSRFFSISPRSPPLGESRGVDGVGEGERFSRFLKRKSRREKRPRSGRDIEFFLTTWEKKYSKHERFREW